MPACSYSSQQTTVSSASSSTRDFFFFFCGVRSSTSALGKKQVLLPGYKFDLFTSRCVSNYFLLTFAKNKRCLFDSLLICSLAQVSQQSEHERRVCSTHGAMIWECNRHEVHRDLSVLFNMCGLGWSTAASTQPLAFPLACRSLV